MTPERTICGCPECRACCLRQPGPLAPGDFTAIRRFLQLDVEAARTRFVRSPGALVAGLGRVFRIGTITPARQANGACVFLTQDGRCSIHEVAPAGCRFFDTHMDMEEADRRSRWLAMQQRQAQYQDLRRTFPPAAPRRDDD